MKGKVIQILWHNKEPVLDVHFQPSFHNSTGQCEAQLFATAGADNDVKIWLYKTPAEGLPTIEYRCSLSRHTRAVNTVKFSPCGNMIASCSDDALVFIWVKIPDKVGEDGEKEVWQVLSTLRGHRNDVYDLAWSPDSAWIVSGSVDQTTIVWDAVEGKEITALKEHVHFVQGVAFDPLNQYFVTQSSDRTCRVYKREKASSNGGAVTRNAIASSTANVKISCASVISKIAVHSIEEQQQPAPAAAAAAVIAETKLVTKFYRMFYDENLPSFFRRPAWSPDGTLLVLPAAQHFASATAYVFSRYDLTRPIVVLPLPERSKPVIAIKFCPLLFQHRQPDDQQQQPQQQQPQQERILDLDYRMLFAVATLDNHPTNITNIDWAPNGRTILVSSSDGFCSSITLEESDLGPALPYEHYPEAVRDVRSCNATMWAAVSQKQQQNQQFKLQVQKAAYEAKMKEREAQQQQQQQQQQQRQLQFTTTHDGNNNSNNSDNHNNDSNSNNNNGGMDPVGGLPEAKKTKRMIIPTLIKPSTD